MNRRMIPALAVCGWLSSIALAQGDPAVVEKIIDEGKNRSHAMEYLEHLSEHYGPRLTGSTTLTGANEWTRETFAGLGLVNAHLHTWGEIPVGFDRGPSKARMIKPVEQEFEFTTRSWTAGTNGPVSGPVIKQPKNMEELEAIRDKLKGAWVLAKPAAPRQRQGQAGQGRRGGDGAGAGGERNRDAAQNRDPDAPVRPGGDDSTPRPDGAPPRDRANADGPASRPARQTDPDEPLIKAMYEAGILGRIVSSRNDLVVTSGARNWRELDFDNLPTEVSLTVRRRDYDSINSRLADGEEVVIEADLKHDFVRGPIAVSNTVAEIPGTEHPEQVIIVSGHLDTWDGPGTRGSQDNGVGSATTIESARILIAAGVKPKRTIRFCLWTGEEQGLLGSREYVKSLSDEEKANISAVFVDDGGTNYDGGLQCVANMEAMLKQAVEPVDKAFPDMPVKINVRERMPRGGASDHSSFNQAGIPGFFWDETGKGGQEGKDYTFIHHTQNDIMRYVVPEYLVQSATCAAVTAYNLSMADTLLPRYTPPKQPEETPSESPAVFTVTQGPATGVWDGTIERPQQAAPAPTGGQGNPSPGSGGRGFGGFGLAIEMSADNHLRGTITSRLGESKITGGTFDPATKAVQFRVRNEFMGTVTYKGTLDGDSMSGTMSNADGEFSLTFKATRTSTEAPPAESPVASDKPATDAPADAATPVEAPAAPTKPVGGS